MPADPVPGSRSGSPSSAAVSPGSLRLPHCATTATTKISRPTSTTKRTCTREIGARVGMSLNAARILDKIGLFDRAHEITGNVWLSFRRNDTGDEIVTIREYEEGIVMQAPVHQAEFLELLVREIQACGASTLHIKLTVSESGGNQ